jgi:hypothetical protein
LHLRVISSPSFRTGWLRAAKPQVSVGKSLLRGRHAAVTRREEMRDGDAKVVADQPVTGALHGP